MRKAMWQMLNDIPDLTVPMEFWLPIGSIGESVPEGAGKHFVVIRYSLAGTTVTRNSPVKEARVEFTVHDAPGSYERIDGTLRALEQNLPRLAPRAVDEWDSVSHVLHDSRGPDLQDDGYGTICKLTSFTLIGRG